MPVEVRHSGQVQNFHTHISLEKISLPAQDSVFLKETFPIVSIAPSRAHFLDRDTCSMIPED